MGIKTKSARGEVVDFDLLKIKEQIASAPPPTDVKARQSFVDRRMRRRVKKAQPKVETEDKDLDPKMPAPENLTEEPKMINEVKTENFDEGNYDDKPLEADTEEKSAPTQTKQKARPRGRRRKEEDKGE